MPDDQNQRNVFDFLAEKFRTQDPFTKADVQAVTDWTPGSFSTYWSKQLKQLVLPLPRGMFRMSEAFRRFASWERFQELVTQVRSVSSDYTTLTFDNVIIYEFFMPLTNEEHLRTSLDALFFKDTVEARLRALDQTQVQQQFPKFAAETEPAYTQRLLAWLSDRFGGYSISHVSGRFKAAPLMTIADSARMQEKGGRYLVDETTAIARFIFPVGDGARRDPPLTSDHFTDNGLPAAAPNTDVIQAEANRIRWFFGVLFVQSIVQVINGEAEIWMIESGMRHRLHIWRVEG